MPHATCPMPALLLPCPSMLVHVPACSGICVCIKWICGWRPKLTPNQTQRAHFGPKVVQRLRKQPKIISDEATYTERGMGKGGSYEVGRIILTSHQRVL